MNAILILIDSLNRHHLSAYAPTHVQTPNLDAFAQRAWRFENHFVGSLPCMPARREIFSGFKEMMWRPWGPLEIFDARLPKILEVQGYNTAIVTDHYHYWEEAANGYIQCFQSAELIRGHEIDFWKNPVPDDMPVPQWVKNIERWRPGRWARQYYANVKDFTIEEDFFPAKVFSRAKNWLDATARTEPFFLQVESFDVHEPFHIPEPYVSMYGDPAAMDKYTLWPPYQNVDHLQAFLEQASEEELAFIRAQYAGKLTMVDRWFGELLKTFDSLSLWDDTMIIVTTDHGHDLGERGVFGKQYPHWDTHANIPLLVWHPDYPGNGRRITALTQTVDVFTTILDALDAPIPERTHSRSIMPLLRGDNNGARQALIYAFYGQGVCCTDGEWTVFKSPVPGEPLYYYSTQVFRSLIAEHAVGPPTDQGYFIPGVEFPQWKIPVRMRILSEENFLFHRAEDPGQTVNLWGDKATERKRMLDILHDRLAEEDTPPEQYTRLGLQK